MGEWVVFRGELGRTTFCCGYGWDFVEIILWQYLVFVWRRSALIWSWELWTTSWYGIWWECGGINGRRRGQTGRGQSGSGRIFRPLTRLPARLINLSPLSHFNAYPRYLHLGRLWVNFNKYCLGSHVLLGSIEIGRCRLQTLCKSSNMGIYKYNPPTSRRKKCDLGLMTIVNSLGLKVLDDFCYYIFLLYIG